MIVPSVNSQYARHFRDSAQVAVNPEFLFDYLDDQRKLGQHMEKPSMMMMGGSMQYHFDKDEGKAVGSVIGMTATIMGLHLAADEVVTERLPPRAKMWETVGTPRLLVVGAYEMGFQIDPENGGSRVAVFINYDPAQGFMGKVLCFLFGGMYAQWCVKRMVRDAAQAEVPTTERPVAVT